MSVCTNYFEKKIVFFFKKLSLECICKEQNLIGFQVIKIINDIQQRLSTLNMQ